MYIIALDSFFQKQNYFDRMKIAREKCGKDIRIFEHFREVCIHALDDFRYFIQKQGIEASATIGAERLGSLKHF